MAEHQARMSSREFTEWQAYTSIEPVGPRRADRHMAVIASTIVNMLRDPKKPGVTAQDFLDDFADFWPDEPVLDDQGNEVFTPEEIAEAEARLMAFAQGFLGDEVKA